MMRLIKENVTRVHEVHELSAGMNIKVREDCSEEMSKSSLIRDSKLESYSENRLQQCIKQRLPL